MNLLEFVDDENDEGDHLTGDCAADNVSSLGVGAKLCVAEDQLLQEKFRAEETSVGAEKGVQIGCVH